MGGPSPGAGGAGQPDTAPSKCHKKIKLVDAAKLCGIIKSLKLCEAQEKSMKDRWLRYVLWWDSRAKRAKRWYQFLQGTVVIGSAAVPVLLALSQVKQLADDNWWLIVGSISISFLVAVCAGIESLFGFGDTWREKRDACELIKSEGYSFFQKSDVYEGQEHRDAYPKFAANVEKLISSEIKEYLGAAENRQKTSAAPPDSGQLMAWLRRVRGG